MDRSQITTHLIDILRSNEFSSLQIDVTRLTEDTSLLNDIALDSIQVLEFVVAIERTFGLKVNTRRLNIDIFDRFGRVIDFVADVLAERGTAGRAGSRATQTA